MKTYVRKTATTKVFIDLAYRFFLQLTKEMFDLWNYKNGRCNFAKLNVIFSKSPKAQWNQISENIVDFPHSHIF